MVVNTLKLFGHYYAATELPQIIEYDPVTLETLGKVDLTPLIPGNSFRKYIEKDLLDLQDFQDLPDLLELLNFSDLKDFRSNFL